jgi:hypothetical protein
LLVAPNVSHENVFAVLVELFIDGGRGHTSRPHDFSAFAPFGTLACATSVAPVHRASLN